MTIDVLNSLVLPDVLGIERHPERVFECAADAERYDSRTLFYDALYIPRRRAICLICPRLHNLSTVVEEADFFSEGRRLRPRIKRTRGHHEEIWLSCKRTPDTLRVRIGALDWEIPVSLQDRASFKGLWCAMLKSKDNGSKSYF